MLSFSRQSGVNDDTGRSNEDTSFKNTPAGISTINRDDISPNTPGSLGGLRSGSAVDYSRQVSQAHLLEQLIGMQNAIESMETPMEQSEETMSVFMNMLEADAGFGEFEDLSFKPES